ncbi:MAG: hypothetical protein M0R74_06060 [Dehalococcoidia bacterium]|nr:hypothetical protein [Dehalococcoidia bacterium]
MIKIKKITSPDAWELRQARIDEAIVTGRPFVERPSYFEHVDTGQKYYDLFGCIGWPTEDTDKDKGRPGYVAVVAVVKSERPIQNAWFRLMGEGESEHISELFAHILRLREEYGFGLQPALLQTFLGDPDKHTTRLALLNEELIKKYGDNGAILVAPPEDFYCPDIFENYRRALDEAIISDRFAFGGNEILKVQHRQFKKGDPAIMAVGGLVHSLIVRCMWMDQVRDNIFTVED